MYLDKRIFWDGGISILAVHFPVFLSYLNHFFVKLKDESSKAENDKCEIQKEINSLHSNVTR